MKKILTTALCLLLVLSMVACGKKTVEWNGNTEVFADLFMVEDITDNHVYVGMVDNVFVGTVEKIDKNIIPKKSSFENSYSVYEIRVDKNLKGHLIENIICSKLGGFRNDGTMVVVSAETQNGVLVDNGMPEAGKQYIFMSYSQPDGSIVLSEIFDNRECNDDLIHEYQNYVENQTNIERERFTSNFEKEK